MNQKVSKVNWSPLKTEIQRPTFQALALCQSESRNWSRKRYIWGRRSDISGGSKTTEHYGLINPLSPSIKLQILLLCFLTFLAEVVGRSC